MTGKGIIEWISLAALIVLVGSTPVHGQALTVLVNPFEGRGTSAGRVDRLQIGVSWTKWDLPSSKSGVATLHTDTRPNALVTADYFISQRLAVGGWWNRLGGAIDQTGRDDLPRHVADSHNTLWDVHGTYYLPGSWRRWSLQLGYITYHQDTRYVPALGRVRVVTGQQSLSLWITRTARVDQHNNADQHPIYLYTSLGYFTSSQFNHETNLILGGSLGLARHVRLSGSLWLNNLADVNLRTTVGLVGDL